jgi:D-methionine transport system ATP-binding protein
VGTFIHIQGAKKHYGNTLALCIDNLHVERGKIFGVMGKSGAGKTTLMRCLLGLEELDQGNMCLNDTPVLSQGKKHLDGVGVIFQTVNLLSTATVWDNIVLPLKISRKAVDKLYIQQLLNDVGLSEKASMYPSSLSGGQQQRVAIARALCGKENILLCDEFTSALDPQTTQEILDLLLILSKKRGISIFFITHDMGVIEALADDVAVMDQGKIVESGAVEDIFLHPTHPITQRFLGNDHLLPSFIRENIQKKYTGCTHVLLRMSFSPTSAGQPLVAQAMGRFDIPLNIIGGHLQALKHKTLGTLWVTTPLKHPRFDELHTFLKDNGITVTVGGYLV